MKLKHYMLEVLCSKRSSHHVRWSALHLLSVEPKTEILEREVVEEMVEEEGRARGGVCY